MKLKLFTLGLGLFTATSSFVAIGLSYANARNSKVKEVILGLRKQI